MKLASFLLLAPRYGVGTAANITNTANMISSHFAKTPFAGVWEAHFQGIRGSPADLEATKLI